jgi:transposase
MPEPLSVDLRERIVAAYGRGSMTRQQVADMFQVGRASVNRLVRRFRETGKVEPNPHGGGKPRKLTARGEKALRALVVERPDATIPELVRLLEARTKLLVSTSTMSRELAQLGFTRKKSPSSPPSKAPPTSKRFARVFEPGRKPWTLVISSSSTKRGPTSGCRASTPAVPGVRASTDTCRATAAPSRR